MALLRFNAISSLKASCLQPQHAYNSPLPHFSSIKTHQQLHNSPLSFSAITTRERLFSLSTSHRKLLCKPPQGKYVREDYLVKKKTAEEIQELVRGERNVPLIIDFYATWCGPCILMAQELEMNQGVLDAFISRATNTVESITSGPLFGTALLEAFSCLARESNSIENVFIDFI